MVYLQPTLQYEVENFSSFFQTTSQLGIRIMSSPIELLVKTPKEALDESNIEYEISYENKGGMSLNNLNMEVEYPDGLIYQESVPASMGENNLWHLGDLAPGNKGAVKIKNKIDGHQFDTKTLKVIIYKNENNGEKVIYSKAEGVIKIVVPPLSVNLKINEKNKLNINLGDRLNFKIDYANRGDIGFKDVIIKLKLDSPIIDFAGVDSEQGVYNSATKEFTWKVAEFKNLKKMDPGDIGQITITIPIKKVIEVQQAEDRNYLIEAVATIDSSDVAYHSLGNSKNISSTVLAKLNSKIILENSISYEDADIKNYGPSPEKIGEETTYTVSWNMKNFFNDISDVKVYSVLPTWVRWKGVTSPQSENIIFNERTQEIIWNVGNIKNGIGIFGGYRRVKFQIGIVPEVNQGADDLKIKQIIKITGRDNFTLENILIELNNNIR
jgi:hypothetical protein